MCHELADLPLAHPAFGYLRSEGFRVGYAGLDSDVAALTIPRRLPADGRCHVVKRDGSWQLQRLVDGSDISLEETTIVGRVIQVGTGDNDLPVCLIKAEAGLVQLKAP